jgi:hypothetical protein
MAMYAAHDTTWGYNGRQRSVASAPGEVPEREDPVDCEAVQDQRERDARGVDERGDNPQNRLNGGARDGDPKGPRPVRR